MEPDENEITIDDWISQRTIVKENGCLIWKHAYLNSGYGKLRKGGKWWAAHRYVYATYVEPIKLGYVVRHKCHTKLCVNPNHLMQGTYQANYVDQIENGKSKPPRGEFRPIEYYKEIVNRKITECPLSPTTNPTPSSSYS